MRLAVELKDHIGEQDWQWKIHQTGCDDLLEPLDLGAVSDTTEAGNVYAEQTGRDDAPRYAACVYLRCENINCYRTATLEGLCDDCFKDYYAKVEK